MKREALGRPALRILISREEVEAQDVREVLTTLILLLRSAGSIRAACEGVEIEFAGYDEDRREVCEIPEVRDFVRRLDEKFPFWLYFLDKRGIGLRTITMCFMPADLPHAERSAHYPRQLNILLSRRWLPALNHVCAHLELDEARTDALTARAMHYLAIGPRPTLH